MRTNVIITDNFYSDPDRVRQFALSQEFKVRGNFPGSRTQSFWIKAQKMQYKVYFGTQPAR